MGYCTLGYILIGPERISEAAQDAAILHIQAIRQAFSLLKARPDLDLDSVDSDAARLTLLSTAMPRESAHLIVDTLNNCNVSYGHDSLSYVADIVHSMFEQRPPQTIVTEFALMWDGHYRDTMSRQLPSKLARGPYTQIVTTSERSWGDPLDDDGSGAVVDRIEWCGALSLLGVL